VTKVRRPVSPAPARASATHTRSQDQPRVPRPTVRVLDALRGVPLLLLANALLATALEKCMIRDDLSASETLGLSVTLTILLVPFCCRSRKPGTVDD
jgi:hypothetical protein